MSDRDSLHLRPPLRPHPDVVARRVDDEAVLVQLGSNQVYSLNRTGARLWELLSEGSSPAEAYERMLVEFDVSPNELRAEVDAFLELLLREQLVSVDDG
jgi:hypothetical protein